jgi:N-acetyl-anhydromuramyl-L-alanine amidase AmpD
MLKDYKQSLRSPLSDYTDAWTDLMEPEEEEEPITQKEWKEYYQSIYQDWYDTKTEDRFNRRDNINHDMSDGLTGKG